ncbi:MAG TPA: extracellular solute-binding protein [Candidatus Limiplasma sp.]|nr:extracellular solute-binding protein [Candidatus Limiplasma sp.]HPS81394.1 extracellular solute-binding protein [Candidatus Limiplasma sp.]
MKKLLSILLALGLALSVTCAMAEPVTIKFAAQADSTPATQAVIDAFNASQDQYKVEWVDMTNDSGAMREQLTTSLKAGSAEYDVLSLDVVWAGEFAASGYIQPLDMMIEDAGLNVADFNAGSMASGLYNGKEYVLPFFPDLGLLYFRKDIVSEEDAAKLVAGTYTWDDLLTMAEKYAGQGGTTTGIVFQSSLYEGLICNANEFTSNWTDIKGGLETMKKFTSSKAVPSNILNYTEGETANSFIKGESVFARNWPYQWGAIKSDGTITTDQVAVAPLPGGSTVGGWLLAINKNSVNPEGAFAFIQYLNSEEGQLIMSEKGGYLPGLNKMLTDERITKADERLSMVGFQNALKTTIARPVSAEYSKVSDALQQAIYPYLSGSSDIDATVTAVEAALAQ